MTARTSYDALVVGARCAGAATAMLLARWGLRVLMIDRGDYGTDTISTHALMRAGVLQLHRWGLLPRIQQVGTPPINRAAFQYGDEVVEIAIAQNHGVGALYAPRRTLLDRVLVDAAWEAGAEIRFAHALVGLKRDRGDRVCGALLRDGAGEPVELEADLVIGADGLGSTVARLAAAPIVCEGTSASSIIYGYFAGLGVRGYRWSYRPGASAGVIPTNDGFTCIFAGMPSPRFRAGLRGPDGFRRVLAEAAPEFARNLEIAQPEGPLSTFAGRKGFLRQAWGPGWALVGDAGYFKDPLAAHGISDALRDAELLARAVVEGSAPALDRYAAVRDELSRPFLEASDAVASFDWDLETVRRHHHALNAAMKQEVEHLAALDPAPVGAPRSTFPAKQIEEVLP
jgi:2-polyprenyl-6-methoxyphenol hydroxylase-like FAD-dependent oxidoreductase